MERISRITYILSKGLAGILVALTFISCGESYPGLEYEKDDNSHITNTESSNKTPIQIYVNEPSLFSITASRGIGAIDKDDDSWNVQRDNMLLRVFAFHNAEDADFRENMYVSHNGEESPDFKNCLIDNATSSGDEYYEGKPAKLVDDEGLEFLLKDDSEEREILYYSSKYQDEGYNFFAYYVDDIELSASNTVRNKDEIYHNIEIDGTQDIMCGFAPKMSLYAVMYALRYVSEKPKTGDQTQEDDAKRIYNMLSPSQQADINNVLNYGYSTYAAHRGVNPVIDIRHQLTRLRFSAYPGDETAQNITIQGIEVKTHTKGKLTVATNDLSTVGLSFNETDPLNSVYLKEESVDGKEPMQPLRKDHYIVTLSEEDKKKPNSEWLERTSLPIGGCLLVEPGDVISLTLHYDEKRKVSENGEQYEIMKDLKVNYNITAPKVSQNFDKATGKYRFREGYSYDINIAVFGLQPIEIYAQMEGWKDGDDVNLGEEDFFDTENK